MRATVTLPVLYEAAAPGNGAIHGRGGCNWLGERHAQAGRWPCKEKQNGDQGGSTARSRWRPLWARAKERGAGRMPVLQEQQHTDSVHGAQGTCSLLQARKVPLAGVDESQQDQRPEALSASARLLSAPGLSSPSPSPSPSLCYRRCTALRRPLASRVLPFRVAYPRTASRARR
jgi:hypothetical protein